MTYRIDIQILRGISVLYVVLFHLGFTFLQSGFLGVDVFFVISGFLMAILYDKYNKIEFYRRRAIRLLPAYYLTIFATLLACFLLTTPNETKQVVEQAKYGAMFASNIGFWMLNSYFSKSEFNPLLHLWSLGVEIQFYILVPLIAWAIAKHRLVCFALIFSSLLLCLMVVEISPKTSFFMMPLRLWEFLLGFGAAHFFTNKGAVMINKKAKWCGFLGAIVICTIPLLNVDGESLSFISGHPGMFALIISIATCLVLIFGLPAPVENSIIARSLERIGKYSYSIYLAHFPVIVIYLSEPFAGTSIDIPSFTDGVFIVLLIFSSTFVLYNLMEKRKLRIRMRSLIAGSVIAIFVLTFTLPTIRNTFIQTEEKLIFNAFSDRSVSRCGKLVRILHPKAISCDLTPEIKSAEHKMMLVGNSHADAIKTVFIEMANKNEYKLYFIVKSTPLMKGGLDASAIVEEASLKNVDKIILHYKKNSIDNSSLDELVALTSQAGIEVYFIEPVPIWDEHIPQAMYRSLNQENSNLPSKSATEYLSENSLQLTHVRSIDSTNFNVLSVVDSFCKPDCKFSSETGAPWYFDDNHLTVTGSRILVKALESVFMD